MGLVKVNLVSLKRAVECSGANRWEWCSRVASCVPRMAVD